METCSLAPVEERPPVPAQHEQGHAGGQDTPGFSLPALPAVSLSSLLLHRLHPGAGVRPGQAGPQPPLHSQGRTCGPPETIRQQGPGGRVLSSRDGERS